MIPKRVFVAFGSNQGDEERHLRLALAALDQDGLRVAACARPVRSPYEGGHGAPVLNTVIELSTGLPPRAVLERLLEIERIAGRVRDGGPERTLDLDLLAHGESVLDEPGLTLPHPRLAERAFVLAPFEEIAALFPVPVAQGGGSRRVVELAAALRQRAPERFESLEIAGAPAFAGRAGRVEVLPDRAALDAWRAQCVGRVGVVPTMGALHPGHASLVQRAAAECDAVLATVFINPLQFAPGEDLERYPRTFEEDCALLAHHGADAVYAPAPEDLFPAGFATHVQPSGVADGFEGALRPGHFRGVATVVLKLWNRARPDRAYFARKDAQQLAVLQQLVRDLDLSGVLVPCATVRASDGLALSSRNRYLGKSERCLALELNRTLAGLVRAAARGERDAQALAARGGQALRERGFEVDYLDIVDARSMQVCEELGAPALAIAAVRLAGVRLIDNRWVAPGPRARPDVRSAPGALASESP